LLSTVAATILLSAGVAFAQAPAKDKDSGASPAPAAQQNAPAEKTAPNMKAGQPNAETHKAPATTGQAPAAQNGVKPGNPDKASDKGTMDNKATQSAPLKPSDADGSRNTKPNAAQNAPAAAPNAAPKASQSTTTEQRSTTGQGSAAGAAKLSTEQRTKITTVIKRQKVERVEPSKLNISISVGTRVPSTVKYHPIPQEVIVIYPEWRGFDYILVGDQIVVLDPHSHAIVAILEA
jgi:hypothetical protein